MQSLIFPQSLSYSVRIVLREYLPQRKYRLLQADCHIGTFGRSYTINNIIQIMQGSFKLYSTWRWSYIFALQKLYCCYAAVILYSPPKLGEAQYHLRSKYNWRSQYNSPKANITENTVIVVSQLRCFHGAGYGSRTRLHGLGSRCITDIRTLHSIALIIAEGYGKFNSFLSAIPCPA